MHNSPHSFVCEVIEYLLQEEKVSVDQNGITDNYMTILELKINIHAQVLRRKPNRYMQSFIV